MDMDTSEEKIPVIEGDIEDIKGRDLSSAVVERAKKPKPTWFVRRIGNPNAGQILAVEEKEAWDMINNQSQWKRRDFQFVGFSDGTTYKRVIDESMHIARRLEPEMAEKRKLLEKYRRGEEKMLIDEAVDMNDLEDPVNAANVAKVKRIQKIISDLEADLDVLEEEYRKATSGVVKAATEAEQKVAMENWKNNGAVWPGDVNIHTPGVNTRERKRIIGAMTISGMG